MVSPMRLLTWTPLAALLIAVPAGAQPSVSLAFADGRVTLSARNAPVRLILNEWARVGGATIVNAERVGGAPVTIELVGVPEREALHVLLRGLAGYALGARPAGSIGASVLDRIVLLPTSVAPANAGNMADVAASRPAASAAADTGASRPAVPAFVAQRPDLGVEGNPPPGSQPRGTGVFGPDFRERPPVAPSVPTAPEETPESATR